MRRPAHASGWPPMSRCASASATPARSAWSSTGSSWAPWGSRARSWSGASPVADGQDREQHAGTAGAVEMADSSFDLVSDFDQQELVNALDQVRREVATRYDFKGAHVNLELTKTEIVLQADDEYRASAVKDLIQSKAVRRNLSLKIFDWGAVEPAGGGTVRQHIGLKRGLTSEQAK